MFLRLIAISLATAVPVLGGPTTQPSTNPALQNVDRAATESKALVDDTLSHTSPSSHVVPSDLGKGIAVFTVGRDDLSKPNSAETVKAVVGSSQLPDKMIYPLLDPRSNHVYAGMTMANVGTDDRPHWTLYRFGGDTSAEVRLSAAKSNYLKAHSDNQVVCAVWVQDPFDVSFLVVKHADGEVCLSPARSIKAIGIEKGGELSFDDCMGKLRNGLKSDR